MAITLDGTNGITSSGDLTLNNGAADGAQVKLSSSGYSDWNLDNYSGTFRAYYNSTEYFKVTSAGLMQFNSGYGSVATAYGCRAWVNFNGTGTVAIRASGNVTSITDNGTGDYTINFTSSMPDVNYTASGMTQYATDNIAFTPMSVAIARVSTAIQTSSLRIRTFDDTGSYYDQLVVGVQIFR